MRYGLGSVARLPKRGAAEIINVKPLYRDIV